MELLEIFPLKVIASQALLVFSGCPASGHFCHILFSYLQRNGIKITLLVEGHGGHVWRNLVLVISLEALQKVQAELETLRRAMEAQALSIEKPVAVIRILGPHFDIRPGIAGLLYERLAKAGIRVLANSVTITTALLVVYESEVEGLQRELGRIFRLPKSK